jgi:hypothetical protein
MPMPYWSVPAAILDDQEEFEKWAKQAITVAHAGAPKTAPKVSAKKASSKPKAAKKAAPTKKASQKKSLKAGNRERGAV